MTKEQEEEIRNILVGLVKAQPSLGDRLQVLNSLLVFEETVARLELMRAERDAIAKS